MALERVGLGPVFLAPNKRFMMDIWATDLRLLNRGYWDYSTQGDDKMFAWSKVAGQFGYSRNLGEDPCSPITRACPDYFLTLVERFQVSLFWIVKLSTTICYPGEYLRCMKA